MYLENVLILFPRELSKFDQQ